MRFRENISISLSMYKIYVLRFVKNIVMLFAKNV